MLRVLRVRRVLREPRKSSVLGSMPWVPDGTHGAHKGTQAGDQAVPASHVDSHGCELQLVLVVDFRHYRTQALPNPHEPAISGEAGAPSTWGEATSCAGARVGGVALQKAVARGTAA